MTTSTKTETKQFYISYCVVSSFGLYVERDANITKEELLESITRDDLHTGEADGEWDGLKDAWREGCVNCIYDEGGNDAFETN
jgi:hypothetical protein